MAGDVHALAARGSPPAAPHEQLQQPVLRVVGVLVLVHEHVLERLGVSLAHLLVELEQVDRAQQQIVEVHRVHAHQLALIQLVHLGDDLLELRADRLRALRGRQQLVLGLGYLAVYRRRREALGVDADLLDAPLHHAPRVRLVVDREATRIPEPLAARPQDARAGGVEGHQPHPARLGPEQALDPPAHLLGRLVGERDREDLARVGLAGEEQERDPVGEHARLAAARPREDEERPLAVRNRLALGLVEAL